MLFNSFEFIFVFFPILSLIIYAIPQKNNHNLINGILVVASLFFYSWWNPVYLPLFLFSIFLNYLFGSLLTGKIKVALNRKFLLILGITINLVLLGYYKYANFFVENINTLLRANFANPDIILPLGISFFTFQQVAYLVDAYRQETEEYNLLNYALFVSFFSQLIAGPIVHHKDIIPQFNDDNTDKFNSENIVVGITIFIFGLFKKVFIADNLAKFANPIFDQATAEEPVTMILAWSGALAYTLQLYFDFSGYSDMAIGSARILGIKLPMNFNSPYKANSIRDFWRRWHITLSNVLRDYLYIPLGGNRQGETRTNVNLFLTMLLGGFWHGAGWTFVLWGGLHGIYLVINRQWDRLTQSWVEKLSQTQTKLLDLLGGLITFIAVVFAWVFFRATDMKSALLIVKGMLGLNGISLPSRLGDYLGFLSPLGFSFEGISFSGFSMPIAMTWIILGLVIALFLPNTQEIMREYEPTIDYQSSKSAIPKILRKIKWQPNNLWVIICTVITIISLFSISKDNEFIYFQF